MAEQKLNRGNIVINNFCDGTIKIHNYLGKYYPNCNTQVAEAIWKSGIKDYYGDYKDTDGYPAGFYWWNSGVPTKNSTAHPYLADIG